MNYILFNTIPYPTITARGLRAKSLEQMLIVLLQVLVALVEAQ